MNEVALSADRRDGIDVARSLALLVVVLGHLTLAVVDRHAGAVRGANLFALAPGWSWIAVAAPMPVFFAAAGWANATSSTRSAAPRLRSLVGVAAVAVGIWSVAVLIATLVAGKPGAIGSGARLATQPLWFLAAYLPLAASGGVLARVVVRRPKATLLASLGVLAVLDAVRFQFNGPNWIGWFGFLIAWSVPWLAGAWWRGRATDSQFSERRTGVALVVGFGLLAAALVIVGGYEASLIDAVKGGRSNTTPPTLYTAVVGLAQVGVLMLFAGGLDGLGRRRRRLWDRLGGLSVGLYVWHLSALALCAGVLALGVAIPRRLTIGWWLLRPVWFGVVLAIATVLALLTAGIQRRLASSREAEPPVRNTVWLGIALAAIGAALIGLKGPRTVSWAIICSGLFVAGWWLMSERFSAIFRRA